MIVKSNLNKVDNFTTRHRIWCAISYNRQRCLKRQTRQKQKDIVGGTWFRLTGTVLIMLSLLQVVLEMMVNAMTLVTSSMKTVPSSRVPREELCKNQILVKKPNKLEWTLGDNSYITQWYNRVLFSSTGCKGFNGQCMKSGDKLEVDCVNYVCDGQAKSMVPVEKGTVELFPWKQC